ncbi:MAG: sigma-70 family RNA polymerase sigma factor [Candidatus Dadabacteria bacterium]|nr:MAG: sigma-70 family RNA polymerase sigma factor [Candidatus Dadabacteria bacterium]
MVNSRQKAILPQLVASSKRQERHATLGKKRRKIKAVTKDPVEILPPDEEVSEEPELLLLSEHPADAERDGENRALVPYDPLRAYLAEIRQYPKLSKEEEKALAIRYREHGDLNAAYKLIVSNLELVVMIARRYERAARSLLDLIQEGNIGLMDAVRNYDPYREVRFPSYATWWIKAYIIRYIIANWRLVKIGTTQAQRKLFFNLEKEKERLTREGFVPTTKLLAANLDVKESEVVEMQQRLGAPDISVDTPPSDESHPSLHSVLASDEPTAEEALAKEEIQRKIKKVIELFKETIPEREVYILEHRLLAEDKKTLHEVAERFSLSKERVRQIENRIKAKLKEYVLKELGESFITSDMEILQKQ